MSKQKALEFGDIKKFTIPYYMQQEDLEVVGVIIEDYPEYVVITGFRDGEKFSRIEVERDVVDYNQVKLSPHLREKLSNLALKHKKMNQSRKLRGFEFDEKIMELLTMEVKIELVNKYYCNDAGYLDLKRNESKKAFAFETNMPLGIKATEEMDFIAKGDGPWEELYINKRDTLQYKKMVNMHKALVLVQPKTTKQDYRVLNNYFLFVGENDELFLNHKIIFQFKRFAITVKNAELIAEFLNENAIY